MAEKRQMTLNLTDAEMRALDEMAERKELSKTAIIRMSLKLLQLVEERTAEGGKFYIETEDKQKTELALL